MTVGELRKKLKDLPDDMDVILQHDPEGNGFGPLYLVESDMIYDDGEILDTRWSAYAAGMSDEDWVEVLKDGKRCCLLVPGY